MLEGLLGSDLNHEAGCHELIQCLLILYLLFVRSLNKSELGGKEIGCLQLISLFKGSVE